MIEMKLEIADTPISLAYGLMDRKELPKNNGMLFKFDHPMQASFWGKNTYIPLDVAFLDKENKISSIKHISPMSTRAVTSDTFCMMAIEANSGFFDNNNIPVGSQVSFSTNSNGELIATF